jgi:lipopolysaccharide biosynthesis glycosyltransferase
MKINRVAAGIDDNYLGPFLVMLYSAWKTSHKIFEVVVGYVPSNLNAASRKLIQEVTDALGIELEFLEVAIPPDVGFPAHLSPATYIRLLLADALEETFVWLDSDLVCEEGWEQLLERQCKPGIIVCAVKDQVANIDWRQSLNSSIRNGGGDYFNSGVMVVDGKNWSKLGFDKQWRNLLANYTEYHFQWADQCVINFLAKNYFEPLEQKFNFQEQFQRDKPCSGAYIRHFTGHIKPWNYKNDVSQTALGPFSEQSVRLYLMYQSELRSFIRKKRLSTKNTARIFGRQNELVIQSIRLRKFLVKKMVYGLTVMKKVRSYFTRG